MNKNTDKLSNFMNGFTAAVQLSQRAGENGFFIEYTCLVASIIDGFLRIGLILNYQLENKTADVLDYLLYQSDEDKIISERQVYKMALDKSIISPVLFSQLENLYKQRNRVIHRYIVSDISTREVLDIGLQYEQIKYAVSDAVRGLENKQLETGVGMTQLGKDTPEQNMLALLNEMSARKHDSSSLNHVLKKKN